MRGSDPRASDVVDPEAPDLKRLWIETSDIKYPAMAVGRWPVDPPPWAVLACYAEHHRWQQRAAHGNTGDRDGAVLDEVVRVYFRLEDEARERIGYQPSSYKSPARSRVIAIALLHIEGLHPESETLRSRLVAIERRLNEEVQLEGVTERGADGAYRTARYERLLLEWGLTEIGGPDHLHSLLQYIAKLVHDNDSGANTIST